MSKTNNANEVFDRGFNCAQSILYTYGKHFFKDDSSALKLATGFGAGISYRGEMCGAVSGSLMAIGLHYGCSDVKMDLSIEMTYKIIKEFIDSFEKQNGSVICNQLLKSDISTPEGLEDARQNGIFDKTCPVLIKSASAILESLLEKYPVDKSQLENWESVDKQTKRNC